LSSDIPVQSSQSSYSSHPYSQAVKRCPKLRRDFRESTNNLLSVFSPKINQFPCRGLNLLIVLGQPVNQRQLFRLPVHPSHNPRKFNKTHNLAQPQQSTSAVRQPSPGVKYPTMPGVVPSPIYTPEPQNRPNAAYQSTPRAPHRIYRVQISLSPKYFLPKCIISATLSAIPNILSTASGTGSERFIQTRTCHDLKLTTASIFGSSRHRGQISSTILNGRQTPPRPENPSQLSPNRRSPHLGYRLISHPQTHTLGPSCPIRN
jgi:hypothetical protein